MVERGNAARLEPSAADEQKALPRFAHALAEAQDQPQHPR